MIEGKPLRESRRIPGKHSWIDSGIMLVSVRFFIWANKLRSGEMPTNCLLQRRAGCRVPETINHMHCFITSDAKHARHNASLRHLSGVLITLGAWSAKKSWNFKEDQDLIQDAEVPPTDITVDESIALDSHYIFHSPFHTLMLLTHLMLNCRPALTLPYLSLSLFTHTQSSLSTLTS